MKALGGYFELELGGSREFHANGIGLNSGRNAFRLILEARGYRKVFLPLYSCDALLEPITKLGIEYEYYHVDRDLNILFDFSKLKADEGFLAVNYFGIKTSRIQALAATLGEYLIVDNAQAFFSLPPTGVDTFYSPRKFFGVPDGGYLFSALTLERENYARDVSFDRCEHLLIRLDVGPEDGYDAFLANEKNVGKGEPRLMSALTTNILGGIDYDRVAKIRRDNFAFLRDHLDAANPLALSPEVQDVPLAYPFYSAERGLRQRLIQNRIFSPCYWPNLASDPALAGTVEYDLAQNLVLLPIDQRLTQEDMRCIVKMIKL